MSVINEAEGIATKQACGAIGSGFLALAGITGSDTEKDVAALADKTAHLRVFEDENGKMNLSLLDTKGALLVVSQFTLYADCRKGRRPSFTDAALPAKAVELYERFIAEMRGYGVEVATGCFGAHMHVELVNDGPVTIMLESQNGVVI